MAARWSSTSASNNTAGEDAFASDEDDLPVSHEVNMSKRHEGVRKQRIESEQRQRDELGNGYRRLKDVLPVPLLSLTEKTSRRQSFRPLTIANSPTLILYLSCSCALIRIAQSHGYCPLPSLFQFPSHIIDRIWLIVSWLLLNPEFLGNIIAFSFISCAGYGLESNGYFASNLVVNNGIIMNLFLRWRTCDILMYIITVSMTIAVAPTCWAEVLKRRVGM